MLSKSQEKHVKSLLQKKYRREFKQCLVEGDKIINEIKPLINFSFTPEFTRRYNEFSQTKSSQGQIAVVNIPEFTHEQVLSSHHIVFLDHVQDPGNIGAFFRLAEGFGFTLILRECADPFSMKVIRASAGAVFHIPHIEVNLEQSHELLQNLDHQVYKFELRPGAETFMPKQEKQILVFGNEGQGIDESIPGTSVYIDHAPALESLSVSHAGAIALHQVYKTN